MTFTSVAYFAFLPLTLLAFRIAPVRYRYFTLLLASYLFYASFQALHLLVALALVTVVSYKCGLVLGTLREGARRKAVFWGGVGACVAILVLLKYAPRLVLPGILETRLSSLSTTIGISYFTFQAIAYLVDVYLSTTEPEDHFGYHALSLAFFPKLLQGPIERKSILHPQLRTFGVVNADLARSGAMLFLVGLFKKSVLADLLAFYANEVFDNVRSYSGISLILATYMYAFQLYFDFSGYTDMARGTARLFGIELSQNFNRPYLAESVPDFWRKWHMSFSRWIMDYLFKPLQMALRGLHGMGTALALIGTFLISGIWHGAKWGFIVWGLLHGAYLATSALSAPLRKKLRKKLNFGNGRVLKAWKVFVTFNLVCIGWVFFRANTLADGWHIISHALDFRANLTLLAHGGIKAFLQTELLFGKGPQTLLIIALSTLSARLILAEFDGNREQRVSFRPRYSPMLRGSIYATLFILLVLGANNASEQFIYSRF